MLRRVRTALSRRKSTLLPVRASNFTVRPPGSIRSTAPDGTPDVLIAIESLPVVAYRRATSDETPA